MAPTRRRGTRGGKRGKKGSLSGPEAAAAAPFGHSHLTTTDKGEDRPVQGPEETLSETEHKSSSLLIPTCDKVPDSRSRSCHEEDSGPIAAAAGQEQVDPPQAPRESNVLPPSEGQLDTKAPEGSAVMAQIAERKCSGINSGNDEEEYGLLPPPNGGRGSRTGTSDSDLAAQVLATQPFVVQKPPAESDSRSYSQKPHSGLDLTSTAVAAYVRQREQTERLHLKKQETAEKQYEHVTYGRVEVGAGRVASEDPQASHLDTPAAAEPSDTMTMDELMQGLEGLSVEELQILLQQLDGAAETLNYLYAPPAVSAGRCRH